jgi:hypothetical protein
MRGFLVFVLLTLFLTAEAVPVTAAVKDKGDNKKGKGKNAKDKEKAQEELSEEDAALKEGLELAVTRLQEVTLFQSL